MESIRKQGSISVWPSCWADDGDYIWMVYGSGNALLKIHKESKCIEIAATFPKSSGVKEFLITDIVIIEKGVYCIPGRGTSILYYDKKKGSVTSIKLPQMQMSGMKFAGGCREGRFVYAIPCHYRYVIKIDSNTNKIECILDKNEIISADGIDEQAYISSSTLSRGKTYSVVEDTNGFFVYDIKSNTAIIKHIENYHGKFYDLTNNGRVLAASTNNGEIVLFDDSLNMIGISEKNNMKSFSIQQWGKGFVATSVDNGRIVTYNSQGKILDELKDYDQRELDELYYTFHHGLGLCSENGDYFFSRHSNQLWIIENEKVTEKIPIRLREDQFGYGIWDHLVQESGFMNIKRFITGLTGNGKKEIHFVE